jgi:hypothetical protein
VAGAGGAVGAATTTSPSITIIISTAIRTLAAATDLPNCLAGAGRVVLEASAELEALAVLEE